MNAVGIMRLFALSATLLPYMVALAQRGQAVESAPALRFHDSHFHLTNYVQQGTDLRRYTEEIMGDSIGRSTVFGIPLQQQWSHRVTGDHAPTYYLESDAPLYYYSFTDAYIAMEYLRLPEELRTRLDPMITGFNPTDMYAADHIRRVLTTFPGVFSGVGEFTIHKEFVSSKVAGDVASLRDPALDSILAFCEETGLVVILHSDIDNPFPKPGAYNYLEEMRQLVKRHPGTTIIWAHVGLGRVVRPVKDMVPAIDDLLNDPECANLHMDISWDEVAKWITADPSSIQAAAGLIERHPDRFLFGTDNVAPLEQATQMRVYHLYDELWKLLDPETLSAVTLRNYERLFDRARSQVRKWEKAHVEHSLPEQLSSPSGK